MPPGVLLVLSLSKHCGANAEECRIIGCCLMSWAEVLLTAQNLNEMFAED